MHVSIVCQKLVVNVFALIKMDWMGIVVGILIGIGFCVAFPKLPEKLKQMAEDYREKYNARKKIQT